APSSSRARRCASSRARPALIRSSARCSSCARSSSSRSCSQSRRRRSARQVNQLRRNTSSLLRPSRECRRHRGDQTLPALGLLAQPLASSRGEPVVLGPTVVLGGSPLARDQALALQAIERGIERPLFDLERAARDLPDTKKHAVAVLRPEGDGL